MFLSEETQTYLFRLTIISSTSRMLKHIRCLPFIAGMAIGVLLLFFYNAPRKIIYDYPHPQNITDRVYRDNNGICYTYSSKKVECDANEATLRQYPIQAA